MKQTTVTSQTWVVLLVVMVWLGATACDNGCRSTPPPPQGLTGAFELTEVVPEEAVAVIFSEDLAELIEHMEMVSAAFPSSGLAPDSGEAQQWAIAGAKMNAPALAFWHDGQWVLVSWADHERDVELDNWSSSGERAAIDPGMRRGSGWREHGTDGGMTSWASSDGRRIARGWVMRPGDDDLGEVIWNLEEEQRWDIDARHLLLADADDIEVDDVSNPGGEVEGGDNEMLAPDATAVARGIVDGRALMSRLHGGERAGFLRDVLARQLGDVYWSVRPGDDEDSWSVDIRIQGMEEALLPDGGLGQSRGALPDIGGLVRPGAPAVARLSVEPEKFVELLRSTLELEQRQQLDQVLEVLAAELQIDINEDVINNVTGQVAVVVFGIRDEFFEARGVELMASLIRLESTRQAVVIPFEDRQRIEVVLDALTQVSRGALRRQAIRHTIQYAWFDDGALEWAVILGDEHLVIVDSMVAFDHVGSWERSPRPMRGVLTQRGVDTMMEANQGLAVYLDVSTVRGIIKEGERAEMAQWLAPVDALRWETDVDGDPNQLRVTLWSSEQKSGDEDL